MPWWPFSDEPDPASTPTRTPEDPDPESVYCHCCPEHRGRWRIGDVLLCAVCDNPQPKESP